MKPHILIIEDEAALAEVLADNLVAEGYAVTAAADGREGAMVWRAQAPHLVVLDVMLPHIDGFELCAEMRSEGDTTPVLFLSAKGQPRDRVQGLKVGGDDYLPKPFHLPEFLLRIRSLLRRQGWASEAPAGERLEFAGHSIDFRSWNATLADGSELALGERELGILKLLASRPDQVVSRDDILDEVWGGDVFPSSRTVDNFVVRLRKTFETDPSKPAHFHTIWGVGYKFTPEPTPQEGKP